MLGSENSVQLHRQNHVTVMYLLLCPLILMVGESCVIQQEKPKATKSLIL